MASRTTLAGSLMAALALGGCGAHDSSANDAGHSAEAAQSSQFSGSTQSSGSTQPSESAQPNRSTQPSQSAQPSRATQSSQPGRARPTRTPLPPIPTSCRQSGKGTNDSPLVGAGTIQLHGLMFVPTTGPQARGTTKIAWRVTGSGLPVFVAIGPAGQRIRPVWGPEYHGGSTFHQPGSEWGTGFAFPSPGCWNVVVTRAGTRAWSGIDVRR